MSGQLRPTCRSHRSRTDAGTTRFTRHWAIALVGLRLGSDQMSGVGQTRKYSLRANDVRCCPDNRHVATAAPCPFSANNLMRVWLLGPAHTSTLVDVA